MTPGAYVRMFSGRRVYLDPRDNARIHLADVAHGLARISRFTGQTRHRWSVASHSLLVADLAPRELRAAALMHDAAEAFLGDVASPLKSILPDYRALERRWDDDLEIRWGVPLRAPEVKAADRIAFALERRELCPYGAADAGAWDSEVGVPIPANAPPIAKYVGHPRSVAAWFVAEARRLGIPEAA